MRTQTDRLTGECASSQSWHRSCMWKFSRTMFLVDCKSNSAQWKNSPTREEPLFKCLEPRSTCVGHPSFDRSDTYPSSLRLIYQSLLTFGHIFVVNGCHWGSESLQFAPAWCGVSFSLVPIPTRRHDGRHVWKAAVSSLQCFHPTIPCTHASRPAGHGPPRSDGDASRPLGSSNLLQRIHAERVASVPMQAQRYVAISRETLACSLDVVSTVQRGREGRFGWHGTPSLANIPVRH